MLFSNVQSIFNETLQLLFQVKDNVYVVLPSSHHSFFDTPLGFIIWSSLSVIVIMLHRLSNEGRFSTPQLKSIVHRSPASTFTISVGQLQLTVTNEGGVSICLTVICCQSTALFHQPVHWKLFANNLISLVHALIHWNVNVKTLSYCNVLTSSRLMVLLQSVLDWIPSFHSLPSSHATKHVAEPVLYTFIISEL